MTLQRMVGAIVAFGLLCNGSSRAQAELVILRSGNGVIGGTDSLVNVLIGPPGSQFPAVFTAADFASARTGPGAFIIAPHPSWTPALAGDASAKWISTHPGGAVAANTGLYAIDFVLSQPASSATLDLHFAADNFLGLTSGGLPGVNQGVFLNGSPLSGNSGGGDDFFSEFSVVRDDIGPLLTVGTNTLYLNAVNGGFPGTGPAGVIFRATITTTPAVAAIPEPSMVTLFGLGALALLAFTWTYTRRGKTVSYQPKASGLALAATVPGTSCQILSPPAG